MKPLKRHPALIHLSQEHHHTLSLCAKILRNPTHNYQVEIVAHYADLEQHFQKEENQFQDIWSSLPDISLRQRFESEHEQLRHLFKNAEFDNPEWNKQFATLLRDHARFEERELFEKITEYAL